MSKIFTKSRSLGFQNKNKTKREIVKLKLFPKKILRFLLLITGAVLLFHLFFLTLITVRNEDVFGAELFLLDFETNIPTYFSTLILFISSMLLLVITFLEKNYNKPYVAWLLLSFIFLFLSIDEFASIHERFNYMMKPLVPNESGIFYFAWIIPYSIALIAFVLLYTRFLLRLPRKISLLMIISGSIFVSGALGFEVIESIHAKDFGQNTLTFKVLATVEELLEMLGISFFIYTLLKHLSHNYKRLRIKFRY